VEEAADRVDPIHQFGIVEFFDLGPIAFTNSALFMVVSVGLIAALLLGATSSRSLVPGRMQSIAELSYEFVANTVRSTAGSEGMRFFPLVFTLFMFILFVNMVGLVPYAFTVTSHIIVTVSLALLVFLTVVIYGFWKNGLKFFKLFVPHGIPIFVLPLVVFIEVFSFFLRPISPSVRLFANMLAGHIALKVFAGFIPLLAAGLGAIGWAGGVLPLGMVIALTALELLVAFLQAYVFTILTCIYLNDAIHPGH
jgi:F-type H+-transporting ATPase subunit a